MLVYKPMSEPNPKSFIAFGSLLKHLRHRALLTQDELGAVVGYSRAHLARLEGDQRTPDPSIVRSRFLDALSLEAQSPLALRLLDLAEAAHAHSLAHGTPMDHGERIGLVPNNLPFQPTSFVGRQAVLTELGHLLATVRMLTLTGTGGVGKTRLALQLANSQLHDFPDGVWLVELATLFDPASVLKAALEVLGVRDNSDSVSPSMLVDYLRDKQTLLILDNCEHVVEPCAQLANAVLRGCGQTRILATSREVLGLPGEQVWRVPSLSTPKAPAVNGLVDASVLAGYESAQLFVERARSVVPEFVLTAANAPALQQICSHLDGIPLAIELAAARVNVLTPEQIAARLNDRFHLLTSGSRNPLPRHQTLQAMIDWSYQLLSERERKVFRWLSTFVGSWTLEAAEFVCVDDDANCNRVLDVLTHLVDKSLVMVDDTGTERRYALLETLRQYAAERLSECQESAYSRDKHLAYFLDLGKRVSYTLNHDKTIDQVRLVKRLNLEVSNLRRALDWALKTGRIADGYKLLECYYALLIACIGRGAEFLALYSTLFEHPACTKGTYERAMLGLELADLHLHFGQLDQTLSQLEQAHEIGVALNNTEILLRVELGYAWHALFCRDATRARDHFAAWQGLLANGSMLSAEDVEDYELSFLGELADLEGNYAAARDIAAHAYEQSHQQLTKMQTSANARVYGYALIDTGELTSAQACLRESLVDNHALGDRQAVAACLSAYAGLALARGNPVRSAKLFGASEALQQSARVVLVFWDARRVKRNLDKLHQQLGEAVLRAAWAEGSALTLEQAMAYALECA